jgi:ribosomal protein S15
MDPYRLAQMRQRKAANLARQQVLQAERKHDEDPIRSKATPFLDSLSATAPIAPIQESHLNYYLKPQDLQKTLEHSKWLSEPLPETHQTEGAEERLAAKLEQHESGHTNASKALRSITGLENASSKNRTQINIQRCIEEFGRHNTDGALSPAIQSKANTRNLEADAGTIQVPSRVGADTGSSEVQIAILTTKINILATNLKANKDKANKRNLRLMVHKRQKLMAYLRRQDRGGPRWQNVVEKLGLNDAMWKGEISL